MTNTRIFIVEDDPAFGNLLDYTLSENEKYEVELFDNSNDFLNSLSSNPDIIILDYHLPGTNALELFQHIFQYNSQIHVIVLSGQKDVNVVVECYKQGIRHYIVKSSDALLELENAIRNLSETVNLKKEIEELKDKIIDRHKYDDIVGESPAILKTIRMIQKIQDTNFITLITGESGTGKEVVAKAIHYNSNRSRKNFVAVNLGAIPEDLVESELFGHERGAFTGAESRRIGKFEQADKGTIFLDEIGEMSLHLQTKLLRVLQENTVIRLGSNKQIDLDIRVIAATNKDLKQRIAEGKFREDLYYRISGFLIHLPPLRERENDVITLSKHFLKIFCEKNRIPIKKFSGTAYEIIIKHTWPGNVRELKTFVERAVLISDGEIIENDDLLFS